MKITLLKNCSSTQTLAKGESKYNEWMIIWSLQQTSGVGASGNTWISPPGGLYFSIKIPGMFMIKDIAFLSFVPPIAICDSIFELTGIRTQIKWANDVTIEGKKVAGIIINSSCMGNDVTSLITGVGVNCNNVMMYNSTAISIMEYMGKQISIYSLFAKILPKLVNGFENVRKGQYKTVSKRASELMNIIGGVHKIETPWETIKGRVTAVNDDLTVEVYNDNNIRKLNPSIITRII